nr:MAG TPA: hypothetical protein [Caudoviricetes sp.]
MPCSSRQLSRSMQPMPSPRTKPRGAPVALAASYVLQVVGSVTEAHAPVRAHTGRLWAWLTHRARRVSSLGSPAALSAWVERWCATRHRVEQKRASARAHALSWRPQCSHVFMSLIVTLISLIFQCLGWGGVCGWSWSGPEAARLAGTSEQGSAGASDHHGQAGQATVAAGHRACRARREREAEEEALYVANGHAALVEDVGRVPSVRRIHGDRLVFPPRYSVFACVVLEGRFPRGRRIAAAGGEVRRDPRGPRPAPDSVRGRGQPRRRRRHSRR